MDMLTLALAKAYADKKAEESAGSLSTKQVNALDALFKAASYIKDVSAEYAVFCEAFGLTNPDEPSEDVVAPSVKRGSVLFVNSKMSLNGTATERATLVPIGQYLEKGTAYKFSLGEAASTYMHGIQAFVAESANMVFPHADYNVIYDGVTEKLIDSGWITTDFIYTPDKDNCILAVNFKRADDSTMNDSDYALLYESFTIEKIVKPDAVSVKMGLVTAASNSMSKMMLNTEKPGIATRIPIGQYLKKGKSYKLSLGNIATKYLFAVRIFVAYSPDMMFPYSVHSTTYGGVTEQLLATNWMAADYAYTPERDNCILVVNFKLKSEDSMDDSNYTEILENFIFEEIA